MACPCIHSVELSFSLPSPLCLCLPRQDLPDKTTRFPACWRREASKLYCACPPSLLWKTFCTLTLGGIFSLPCNGHTHPLPHACEMEKKLCIQHMAFCNTANRWRWLFLKQTFSAYTSSGQGQDEKLLGERGRRRCTYVWEHAAHESISGREGQAL